MKRILKGKIWENIAVIFGVIFVGIGLFIYLKSIRAFWNYFQCLHSLDPSIAGGIGDFVGGLVTPIFTLSALILVCATYRLQKRELKETKEVFANFLKDNFPENKKADKDVRGAINTMTRNMMDKTLSHSERQLIACRSIICKISVHDFNLYESAGFIDPEEVKRMFR